MDIAQADYIKDPHFLVHCNDIHFNINDYLNGLSQSINQSINQSIVIFQVH